MKVVLLAGGFGTRISEESYLKPKPMIEIGEKPILWHIMKHYSSYGHNEFIICCGYKAYSIKEYFSDYYLHNCDITFDFRNENSMQIHANTTEPWRVTLIDTGLNTMTGGRIKRIQPYIGDEPFMLSYGDGVCDVDLEALQKYHKKHGRLATVTTVNPGQRFGIMDVSEQGVIHSFREKSDSDGALINGGFFVLQPEVFNYIQDDQTIFEKEPLETLAKEKNLMAFRHPGFWQCMDTQRDKQQLEELWETGKAPWKSWE